MLLWLAYYSEKALRTCSLPPSAQRAYGRLSGDVFSCLLSPHRLYLSLPTLPRLPLFSIIISHRPLLLRRCTWPVTPTRRPSPPPTFPSTFHSRSFELILSSRVTNGESVLEEILRGLLAVDVHFGWKSRPVTWPLPISYLLMKPIRAYFCPDKDGAAAALRLACVSCLCKRY